MKQGFVVKAVVYFGEDAYSEKLGEVIPFERKEVANEIAERFSGQVIRVIRPPRKQRKARKRKVRYHRKENQSWLRSNAERK